MDTKESDTTAIPSRERGVTYQQGHHQWYTHRLTSHLFRPRLFMSGFSLFVGILDSYESLIYLLSV